LATLCPFNRQSSGLLVCSLTQPVGTTVPSLTITDFDTLFIDPAYVLLPPCDLGPVPHPLIKKILACLSTRFDITMKDIHPYLRTASLKQYGKVRCLDNGDVMNASTLVTVGDDWRDATFVRVRNKNFVPSRD
jgi:hypothetical protein